MNIYETNGSSCLLFLNFLFFHDVLSCFIFYILLLFFICFLFSTNQEIDKIQKNHKSIIEILNFLKKIHNLFIKCSKNILFYFLRFVENQKN